MDERASRATTLYRWMDLVELESYLGGTFESRTVPGKGRRGCRLFSLWTNGYALERPARPAAPVDDAVRGKLRTAVCTALPRPASSAEERIDSRKHLAKADETECRLEDGTGVPGGTRIRVESHVLDSTPDPRKYCDLLESLRGVVKASVIQELPVSTLLPPPFWPAPTRTLSWPRC